MKLRNTQSLLSRFSVLTYTSLLTSSTHFSKNYFKGNSVSPELLPSLVGASVLVSSLTSQPLPQPRPQPRPLGLGSLSWHLLASLPSLTSHLLPCRLFGFLKKGFVSDYSLNYPLSFSSQGFFQFSPGSVCLSLLKV